MRIKYKRGGKIWRRDVWLAHWYGQPTPWPVRPRRPGPRVLLMVSMVAATMTGRASRR